MSRTTLLALITSTAALTAGALVPAAAATAPNPPAACAPPPKADVRTAEGWLGYLAENPEHTAYVIDDGRPGGVVRHRAGSKQPTASAVKVLHLAAYARAVARDRLDPDERITLAAWEAWWLPGTDGGAHLAALERLGVPHTDAGATDPAATVSLDRMVSAMVRESDNAVPDYLRHRLGDRALERAAARAGWEPDGLPTFAGQVLSLLDPAVRKADRWAAAQRYATDPAYRAQVLAQPVDPDRLGPWVETTYAVTPRDLAGLYRSLATREFGPGSGIALRQLEWQRAPRGLRGLGFKGGNLPYVITDGIEVRRRDGSVAVAVLMTEEMTERDYARTLRSELPQQQLLVAALLDREVLGLLRCVA